MITLYMSKKSNGSDTSSKSKTKKGDQQCAAWCIEIGYLTSLYACSSGAFSYIRTPTSLHQTVLANTSMTIVNVNSIFFLYTTHNTPAEWQWQFEGLEKMNYRKYEK